MLNWSQFGKDSAFAIFFLNFHWVLRYWPSFALASFVLQQLMHKLQMCSGDTWLETGGKANASVLYFDGELVDDIDVVNCQ